MAFFKNKPTDCNRYSFRSVLKRLGCNLRIRNPQLCNFESRNTQILGCNKPHQWKRKFFIASNLHTPNRCLYNISNWIIKSIR